MISNFTRLLSKSASLSFEENDKYSLKKKNDSDRRSILILQYIFITTLNGYRNQRKIKCVFMVTKNINKFEIFKKLSVLSKKKKKYILTERNLDKLKNIYNRTQMKLVTLKRLIV